MPTARIFWNDLSRNELGQRIYRSEERFDLEELPTPLAELPPEVESYVDDTLEEDTAYYYLVESYDGAQSEFTKHIYIEPFDEHWSNVSFLFGFEGEEGSTTFVDESGNEVVLTPLAGTPQPAITTEFSAFDTEFAESCLRIANAGFGLGTPDVCGMDFGTDDFTIEFFIRRITPGDHTGSFSQMVLGPSNVSAAAPISIDIAKIGPNDTYLPRVRAYKGFSHSLNPLESVSSIAGEPFVHIALSRNGDELRYFVDGILQAKGTGFAAYDLGGTAPVFVSSGSKLLFDEFRVTKGVGRYGTDENFPRRTAPFQRNLSYTPTPAIRPATNLEVVVDDLTPSIELTWDNNSFMADGVRLYRSLTPLDLRSLPTPLATLGPEITGYSDLDAEADTQYYYVVEHYDDTKSAYSRQATTGSFIFTLALSGDEAGNGLLLSGDMQSGGDRLQFSGDEQ